MSDVIGVRELLRSLDRLPKKVRDKGTKKAMREAGKIVLKESRSRVTAIRTGLLKQSLANKIVKLKSGDYAALTGARRLKGTKRRPKPGFKVTKRVRKRMDELGLAEINPTRYAHLVELGTPHARAQPFLRPGLKAAKPAVELQIARTISKVIQEEAAKL